MAKQSNYPWFLPVLRDAFRPISEKLHKRHMSGNGPSKGKASNVADLVIDHLDRVAADTKRLLGDFEWLGHVMADTKLDLDSGEADLLPPLASVESRIDRILKNRNELKGWDVGDDDDEEARSRMEGIYDDILFNIQFMFDDWLEFLDDSESAVKAGQDQGSLRISGNGAELVVDLRAPLELDELLDWVKRRALTGVLPYKRTMAFLENYDFPGHLSEHWVDDALPDYRGQDRDGCLPLIVGIALGWMIGSG